MSDLRTQLRTIYDRHGQLTPELLVKAAKPQTHPLHNRFEWDDSVAGPKYRLIQAYDLIKSVKVSYKDSQGERREIREYHPVRGDDAPFVYDPLDVIAEDPVSMGVLLRQAEREWHNMQRRYGHLSEFWEMIRRSAA